MIIDCNYKKTRNYYQIAFEADYYSLEENLKRIKNRKAYCNALYSMRNRHIKILHSTHVSPQEIHQIKKEEYSYGYSFYGFGIHYDKLLKALQSWENFYSPLDEIHDLKLLEDALKYRNYKSFMEYSENDTNKIPDWVSKLIDQGLVDTDGKTVLARNLYAVGEAIVKNQQIELTSKHLEKFIKSSSLKPYGKTQIRDVINTVN